MSLRACTPASLSIAPMDGVTDHVYRALLTARAASGAISHCFSEFVRVTDRPLPVSVIRRAVPELATGGITPSGVPVFVQLLGGAAEPLALTARTAVEAGALGIDLNFGCPAKTVNRHDGGASLLKTPERVERIVARVRQTVPATTPVSVKIRLGWESHEEVVPLARAVENGGASWLTVHGRTKLEMYGPPADWRAIGWARSAVGIPVVANGDLNSFHDIAECARISGCKQFMLGRGPMGRPSLLGAPRGGSEPNDAALVSDFLLEYLERLHADGSSEERQLARVKQWLSLGTKSNARLGRVFERVKRLRSGAELGAQLRRLA